MPLSAPPHRHKESLSTSGDQDHPSSLPNFLSSFVGRERETAALGALLCDPAIRLVTLAGVGGVGKTRLALRVAADLTAGDHFRDGVHFVNLAPVRDPDLVAPVIAQALGVRGVGHEPAIASLKTFLRESHSLLILDNFEQVSEAAPTVVALLQACPGLVVLVTSRSLLNVSGEQVVPVPPLRVGSWRAEGGGDEWPAGSQPSASEAVRLFVERTRGLNPDFALSASNEPIIAEIVQRLDGLPLAIELAAARGALLSPSALLARLERPLPHLTGGPRDQPERHQTMRAAIVWSYDLLTPEEQQVFRALGIFAGGCTLEAAETICASENDSLHPASGADPALVATLKSLVDQSLVQVVTSGEDGSRDDATRIVMLETIREFAAEQLLTWDEQAPVRRHAEFYLALAARAEPAYWGDAPGDWRIAIDREAGNLQAAFDWSIGQGEADLALRLASARFDPHWTTGTDAHLHRRWTKQALAKPGGSPTARQRALTTAAWLAHVHDDFAEGRSLAGQALALAREIGDVLGAASASYVLGVAAFHEGRLDAAQGHLDDALAGFRELDAPGRTAWTLSYLASLDSREAIDEGGNPAALAGAVNLYEEALALFRQVENAHGQARALHGLAYVAWKQRDLTRALALSRQVLHLEWEQRWPIYYHLEDIADIAGRLGAAVLAARLYGAADIQRKRAGRSVEPVFRQEFERDVAVARRALGDEAFTQAWAAGRELPPEQAVMEAEGFAAAWASQDRADLTPVEIDRAGLTTRELEVLHQLVNGLTDREIAERLFITRRTASKHVEAILSKLGVRSRGAAVAEAVRLGFVTSPAVSRE